MDVVTETFPDGIRRLAIDRPERRNALSLDIKAEIARQVEAARVDPEVRVLILTGAGDVFAAGTDVSEMASFSPLDHDRLGAGDIWEALNSFPKPIVAAVEGYALGGGCELALSADIIIAGQSAEFGLPEVNVGIMPGAGGSQRMLRALGYARTMLLTMTGSRLSARDALTGGLISDVVSDGAALARATTIAEILARQPQTSIRLIKQTLKAGQDMPLDSALLLERRNFQILFDSPDQTEGMTAFLERRKPEFNTG